MGDKASDPLLKQVKARLGVDARRGVYTITLSVPDKVVAELIDRRSYRRMFARVLGTRVVNALVAAMRNVRYEVTEKAPR